MNETIVNLMIGTTLLVSVSGKRARVIENALCPVKISKLEGSFQFLPGKLYSATESVGILTAWKKLS